MDLILYLICQNCMKQFCKDRAKHSGVRICRFAKNVSGSMGGGLRAMKLTGDGKGNAAASTRKCGADRKMF